jgi:7,8-dihydropterin-6-yl-methyl-4-(beta-D-ribofuranosyl)aminobenzene 5'-phosphate synthase
VLALCLVGLWLGHYLPVFMLPLTSRPLEPPAVVAPAAMTDTPNLPAEFPSAGTPAQVSDAAQPAEAPTEVITLTILYDNLALDPRLQTAWGFACLVETREATILFDTGGDGPTLLWNMAVLGHDPGAVDAVVLSHRHADHVGGLEALLAVNSQAALYLPQSFPADFTAGQRNPVVEVGDPVAITSRVLTTGEMGQAPGEQALIVQTADGVIVVTGCAHPGLVEIVRQAQAFGQVELILGGFHLQDKSASEAQAVIAAIQGLGVRRSAPCHCTGAEAIRLFEAAFGSGFIPAGIGLHLTFSE